MLITVIKVVNIVFQSTFLALGRGGGSLSFVSLIPYSPHTHLNEIVWLMFVNSLPVFFLMKYLAI